MYKGGAAVMLCMAVCVSVRPYVTFVDCVKTNKHNFKILLPSGSQAILVFLYKTVGLWQYPDG